MLFHLPRLQLATRANQEYRAVDVARLMRTETVIQGAAQYAARCHHLFLAERVGRLTDELLGEGTSAEDPEEEEDWDNQNDENFAAASETAKSCR